MTQKLMSKSQVLDFDLWAVYYNYLLSLQEAFKKELQSKLGDIKINSWIESLADFFDETGKTMGMSDNPDLEEIYFQLSDQVTSVRICVPHGDTSMMDLEFVEDTENIAENGDAHYYTKGKLSASRVFSDEMINAASEWLKEATISSLVMNTLEHYPS